MMNASYLPRREEVSARLLPVMPAPKVFEGVCNQAFATALVRLSAKAGVSLWVFRSWGGPEVRVVF